MRRKADFSELRSFLMILARPIKSEEDLAKLKEALFEVKR